MVRLGSQENMPALPANHVKEANVTTAMPKVNLRAWRLVSDKAPLQVAHMNSGNVNICL